MFAVSRGLTDTRSGTGAPLNSDRQMTTKIHRPTRGDDLIQARPGLVSTPIADPMGRLHRISDRAHLTRTMLLPRVFPPARFAIAVSTSDSSYSAVMSMRTDPSATRLMARAALSANRFGLVWLARLLL